jgi:3-hydroxybutyryl-CoA dehydrogenase
MGQPMGPLQLADFIGLMCVAILNVMYDGFKIQNMPLPIISKYGSSRKMGVKSGEGFYDYSESKKSREDF